MSGFGRVGSLVIASGGMRFGWGCCVGAVVDGGGMAGAVVLGGCGGLGAWGCG